jgi:hypothetical protein
MWHGFLLICLDDSSLEIPAYRSISAWSGVLLTDKTPLCASDEKR